MLTLMMTLVETFVFSTREWLLQSLVVAGRADITVRMNLVS